MAQKHFGAITAVKTTFAFVKSEMDGKTYFLHANQMPISEWSHIGVGQCVEFSVGQTKRGPAAVNAIIMGER